MVENRPVATTLSLGGGMAWAVAAMIVFDMKLSVVNFVGLPILLGMGVDTVIHLLHRLDEEGPGRVRQALATTGWATGLSTATTVVSFAALALATHRGVSAEERALRNVIYTTCCSELVACSRFVATLDGTTDPFFRAAVTRLLADERLHGQFGFQYLAWAQPRLAENAALRDSLGTYLRLGFAVLEQELAPAHVHPIDDAARAVGLECPVEAKELFYATMEEAVVPGLEAVGIAAEAAWKARTLNSPST